jgi:hypothetical protein
MDSAIEWPTTSDLTYAAPSTHVTSRDPMQMTMGLVPRYMRAREAAAARAAAEPPPPPPPAYIADAAARVDRMTAELRRRVLEAE